MVGRLVGHVLHIHVESVILSNHLSTLLTIVFSIDLAVLVGFLFDHSNSASKPLQASI
mgnify:CR=1 FL=1